MINDVINELAKELYDKLGLDGVVQFGSSTVNPETKDIDLLLLFNGFSAANEKEFTSILADYSSKYDISFSFDGSKESESKKGAEYEADIVTDYGPELVTHYEKIFLYFIKLDDNKKVLQGCFKYQDDDFTFTNEEIADNLFFRVYNCSFSRFNKELFTKQSRFILKTCFRYMLLNKLDYTPASQELISKFKDHYPSIKLPEHYEELMQGKAGYEWEAFEFAEKCLNRLKKD